MLSKKGIIEQDISSSIYQEHSVHISGMKMSEAAHSCPKRTQRNGDLLAIKPAMGNGDERV